MVILYFIVRDVSKPHQPYGLYSDARVAVIESAWTFLEVNYNGVIIYVSLGMG